MKKIIWILILTQILIGAMASLGQAVNEKKNNENTEKSQPRQTYIKHIVLITIDGLNEKHLSSGNLPNISSIAGRGVKTTALGVLPANSSAFTASLLTGAEPSVHGLTEAKQQLKTRTFPEILLGYGRTVAMIGAKGSIPKGLYKDLKSMSVQEMKSINTHEIIEKAINIFTEEKPYFTGIYLTSDAKEANRLESINQIDKELGLLINTFNQYGVMEQTLFIIVGRPQETSFKNISTGRMNTLLPVVMSGPGLKISASIPPIKIIDVIPTTAMLTGIQMPPECSGMVLWNALQAGAGYLEENLLLKRVNDLSKDVVMQSAALYQMTEEKRLFNVEQQKLASEKKKIQKTIGDKDDAISSLRLQIASLKLAVFAIIAVMGFGYGVEYVYLRKKFLMF